jgi:hypothetical protein
MGLQEYFAFQSTFQGTVRRASARVSTSRIVVSLNRYAGPAIQSNGCKLVSRWHSTAALDRQITADLPTTSLDRQPVGGRKK